jgi:hypothetical protein
VADGPFISLSVLSFSDHASRNRANPMQGPLGILRNTCKDWTARSMLELDEKLRIPWLWQLVLLDI